MRRIPSFLFLAAIAAAAVRPPTPNPAVPVLDKFHHQLTHTTAGVPAEWWRQFKDPLLDSLMERVAHTNLDVRTAGARVAEALALRGQAKSALFPSIDLTASSNHLRGGFNQGITRIPGGPGSASLVSPFETSVVSAGFSMRWELDIFGGLRNEHRAAAADAEAAESNAADVQIVVRAELARNYIELRGFEEQAAVVQNDIEAERETLELVRVRADAGLASQLDVERQATQLATVQAILPDLHAETLRAAHRIAVLLGEEPGALLAELDDGAPKLAEPEIPVAVPSEVLKRRPDVRRAESQITAAYARAGAARAELFPKFVITGLSGRQSTDLSGITLGAGNFFSVGPGISLPIFNAGRIRMNIAANDARLEQAVHTYEAEILAAFEETENAFVSRDSAEAKRRELENGFEAAVRSVDLAQELYLRGLSDFLTVLDAQRQRFQIERELAASRTDVLRSTVALYKALGE
jgi:NodT family efflux transporter outer membrane factor (OMF) lipoprotein